FSLVAAPSPSAQMLSILFIGALGVAAIVDALNGRRALAGIELALPEVVRFSRNRPAKIEVRVRNQREIQKNIRLSMVLPPEVPPAEAEMEVALPAGSEWSRLHVACQPLRRGRFRVQTSCVETSSPLGFWAVRRSMATPSEVRVYPNLLTERKNL